MPSPTTVIINARSTLPGNAPQDSEAARALKTPMMPISAATPAFPRIDHRRLWRLRVVVHPDRIADTVLRWIAARAALKANHLPVSRAKLHDRIE